MAKKLNSKKPKKIKEKQEEIIKEKKTKTKVKKEKIPKKEKKEKKKGHVGQTILIVIMVFGIGIASLILAFGLYIVFTAPEFTITRLYNKEASAIYDKDNNLITRLGQENRVIKSYDEFPQVLVDALIATEDSRFFQHNGFDAGRFFKASLGQLAGNSDAGGASTITMQLVKKNFTSDEASGIEGIIRKFTDIYMAIFKIEKNYTKQQIIEFYFNSMWLAGGSTNYESINGVEQACQYYFGKSVSDITLPEAAIIVGMYNNPSIFNPYKYPEATEERRNTVLSLMVRHGYITEEEKEDAEKISVRSLLKNNVEETAANPYQVLIDYVVQDVQDKLGINIYESGGYAVKTTFDLNVQNVIHDMQNGAAVAWKDELVQTGVAITRTTDGSIVALGPGRYYVAKGLNRALVKGQPGSTAKPLFDYGPLIEYNNASPQQIFLDYPYTYNNGVGMNNWDNGFYGVMTMKNALSASRNIPALQAFQMVDPKNITEFVHNLGIDYGDKLLEAFSVGGLPEGISPLTASAAYAAFGRGGYYIEPYSFTEVKNLETEEVIEWKYEKKKVMSEETAYLITDILLQATNEGVGGTIDWNLRPGIASKSGTSNIDEARAAATGASIYATPDHWVNTYSPDYSMSIWLGYDYDKLDENHYFTTPTGAIRNNISGYIANRLYKAESRFQKPSGITTVTIEANTLPPKKASANTPANMRTQAMFKAGSEPSETSDRFENLSAPSNASARTSGKTITISWNGISTPPALNTDKVTQSFNNYFKDFAKNYPNAFKRFYNQYMSIYNSYNSGSIGAIGYEIFVKDANGNYKDLGWTDKTTYTYTASKSGKYEFTIKSSYSIFKGNQSNGISTSATILVDNDGGGASNNNGLSATAFDVCIKKGEIFDPKNALSVKYNGNTVTNSATIAYSGFDSSKIDQSQTVTYNVIYQGEKAQTTGKVTISSNGCSDNLD